MNGAIEFTPGDQQTCQQNIKINNFGRFIRLEEPVKSNYIEVFPGKKVAFVVKPLPEICPHGYQYKYISYAPTVLERNWINQINNQDKFFSLELHAAEGLDRGLAGSVDIMMEGTTQTFKFGDPENDKYEKFDAGKRTLDIKPMKVKKLATMGHCGHGGYQHGASTACDVILAPFLIHVKVSGEQAASLEIKFTLFCPGDTIGTQERVTLPESLKPAKYLAELNKGIMEDDRTTDFKVICGAREKKTIFNVHKIFMCAGSPVLRAAITSDMLEAKNSEILIEDVDEKTVQEMINYIYTGELTGVDLDIQMVAWVADKYELPGMLDLLCFRMKVDEVEGVHIADMLLAARRHDSLELQQIAMDKLKANKEILSEPAFREKFESDQSILFDLIQELMIN